MSKDLYLRVNNTRAIHNAEIDLNGISVIAGENGCGKSTISKLTYHILKSAIDYDDILNKELRSDLRKIYRFLDQSLRELSYFLDRNDFTKVRNTFRRFYEANVLFPESLHPYSQLKLFEEKSNFDKSIDYLIEIFQQIQSNKQSEEFNRRIQRINKLLYSRKRDVLPGSKQDFTRTLLELKEDIKNLFEDLERKRDSRPLDILDINLDQAFYDSPLGKNFNIYELNVPVIERSKRKLLPVQLVDNVLYIDTPMIVGIEHLAGGRSHWNYLNDYLTKRNFKNNLEFLNSFEEDIVDGEFKLEDDELSDKSFVFKRKDGKEFNLLECATGLKSFAILQLLAKNSLLTNRSLLVIDEPEVHLHPQWVVEYARFVVLLNKVLGVKFLIASHHPDMISALKYISEKEEVQNINFYLAQPSEVKYQYSYQNLGKEIDPIFSSFNIALDRIDQYGVLD